MGVSYLGNPLEGGNSSPHEPQQPRPIPPTGVLGLGPCSCWTAAEHQGKHLKDTQGPPRVSPRLLLPPQAQRKPSMKPGVSIRPVHPGPPGRQTLPALRELLLSQEHVETLTPGKKGTDSALQPITNRTPTCVSCCVQWLQVTRVMLWSGCGPATQTPPHRRAAPSHPRGTKAVL